MILHLTSGSRTISLHLDDDVHLSDQVHLIERAAPMPVEPAASFVPFLKSKWAVGLLGFACVGVGYALAPRPATAVPHIQPIAAMHLTPPPVVDIRPRPEPVESADLAAIQHELSREPRIIPAVPHPVAKAFPALPTAVPGLSAFGMEQ